METDDFQENSFSFFRKLILIAVFFTLTPIALISSVISLVAIASTEVKTENVLSATSSVPQISNINVYASLPSDYPSISGEVVGSDGRNELIRKFLDRYNSPMEPYASFIVEKSDEYGLDWRLTTAIAMKESGLGKLMPYDDCHNAWGYGIHSAGVLCFDSWEEGIDTISQGLKKNYIDKGYLTVEEIMTKYAHPNSTTWAEGVTYYMDQMR